MESELKTFGARLLFALTTRKMAQSELARIVGVSQQSVSGWINDKYECKSAYEVANALNVNPEWLIDNVGPMDAAKPKTSLDKALEAAIENLSESQKKTTLSLIKALQEE